VGSPVADKATVTGLVSPSSSDTVTFNLYSSATVQNSTTLLFSNTQTVSISGSTATATSTGYTAAATGTDYWVATYNGDPNNNPVTSGTAAEAVTITKATPAITTSPQQPSATAGTSIADTASVSGGSNPTGTVTFNLYNNPNGTGPALFTDTEPLSSGTATSAGYTATAAGADYWVAIYNGDPNNNPVTSVANAEPVTVTPGAPASITEVSGSPQSTTVGQPFTSPLVVVVEDKYSNPVPNVTVTFAAPASGAAAILSSSTATTGSDGQVCVTAMANGIAGTYTVTASVSGVATPASFALTQTLPATGVSVINGTLYIVGGNTSSDFASVKPAGAKTGGSTGLTVNATLNKVSVSKSFTQPLTAIVLAGYAGNETFTLASTLTLPTTVTAGNGNDVIQLGGGSNTVALGGGNDTVSAGGGNNTITVGNGNDVIQLGGGNNTVTAGNGNDTIQLGDGSNVVVEGNGNDTVAAGNGTNMLIDGSATVTNPGDSFRQILNAWTANPVASNQAAIRSRFTVIYNSTYPNYLSAGRGIDWFFYKPPTTSNKKSTDFLN
jgi:hypothetical protein